MKTTISVLIFVFILAAVMPATAHHSFSAEYDLNKPTYMDGKVTKVEWVNPHADVSMNVVDKAGATVNWTVEISPPNYLNRSGWNKDTLQPGMEICVEGFPDKTGIPKFGSTSITLKSGKVLQTPPGNWMADALPVNNVAPMPIQYTDFMKWGTEGTVLSVPGKGVRRVVSLFSREKRETTRLTPFPRTFQAMKKRILPGNMEERITVFVQRKVASPATRFPIAAGAGQPAGTS